jgi:hypothetical protein
MLPNDHLHLHFVNVNHGDCTIVEFPRFDGEDHIARFGVVDFGAKKAVDRDTAGEYFQELLDVRQDGDVDFRAIIEFLCLTHPHDDHYGGLTRFLDAVEADPRVSIRQFWDCGFRINAINYLNLLERVSKNRDISCARVSSGSELQCGKARVQVLAPSVDLRNRFDTYGIGANDASIVMKISFKKSHCVLGADAEFASWAKITEEYPRREKIEFFDDAIGLSERHETADQLKCNLIKVSHHGSKHGTSLEYLERLDATHYVIPAGDAAWYNANLSNWSNKVPHHVVNTIVDELLGAANRANQVHVLGEATRGHAVFRYGGGAGPARTPNFISENPGDPQFATELHAAVA